MKRSTCPIDARLVVPALLGLALLTMPVTARAQQAPTQEAPASPAPPPSTDQSDQARQQPTDQGGATSGASTNAPDSTPPPPSNHRKRLIFGIDAGVFAPTSSKTQNRFGNTWFSAGIGIGAIPKATGHGAWNLDLRSQYQANTFDRHVFVGNLGLEYRRRFDTAPDGGRHDEVPYYGASLDAVFVDVSSPEDDVHSGIDLVPGGSVFVGTNIGRQEYVQLGYDGISSVKGFDFSGVSLTTGVRFY